MCNWFQNKSPTHTFAVDWDTWHGNWAAPCYFNGASPTGSARWGYCLQRHLACEGLYSDDLNLVATGYLMVPFIADRINGATVMLATFQWPQLWFVVHLYRKSPPVITYCCIVVDRVSSWTRQIKQHKKYIHIFVLLFHEYVFGRLDNNLSPTVTWSLRRRKFLSRLLHGAK